MRSSRNSRSSTVGVEDCHGFDGDAEDHGGDDKEKQGAGSRSQHEHEDEEQCCVESNDDDINSMKT